MSNYYKPTGPRAVKRGIWFFMRTIMLVTALGLLCYGVFTAAMNISNMYILVTEGMQLRAECVLQQGPRQELGNYFSEAFLSKDSMLALSVFEDYTITSFDYRIGVESFVALPWSNSASVVITERMASISGSIHPEKKDPNAPDDAEYPLPKWPEGKYKVYFSKRDGRWIIYQIVLLDANISVPPKRTPDMSLSPIPAYKPTPSPIEAAITPIPTPAPLISPEE